MYLPYHNISKKGDNLYILGSRVVVGVTFVGTVGPGGTIVVVVGVVAVALRYINIWKLICNKLMISTLEIYFFALVYCLTSILNNNFKV